MYPLHFYGVPTSICGGMPTDKIEFHPPKSLRGKFGGRNTRGNSTKHDNLVGFPPSFGGAFSRSEPPKWGSALRHVLFLMFFHRSSDSYALQSGQIVCKVRENYSYWVSSTEIQCKCGLYWFRVLSFLTVYSWQSICSSWHMCY